jgi:hypothetical protein
MSLPCRHYFAWAMFVLASVFAPSPAGATVDIIFQDGFQIQYGFQVQTPSITVPAGTTAQYCYYFHTPNTGSLGIHRWLSTMGAGMHHMIVYTTSIDRQPAGTLTQIPCGLNTGGGSSAWLYIAHDLSEDLVFPTDDGSGNPLAVEIAAGQAAVIEMYVINNGDQPVTTSALLKAEALDPAISYTKSATYLAQNFSFTVPADTSGFEAQNTCAVPTGAKFWWLSTRTHSHASSAKIIDQGMGGSDVNVVVSNDWEHPAVANFAAPNFFVFSSFGLTYDCIYNNPTGALIQSGDSETADESCIGVGYFFPAMAPASCIDDIGPF